MKSNKKKYSIKEALENLDKDQDVKCTNPSKEKVIKEIAATIGNDISYPDFIANISNGLDKGVKSIRSFFSNDNIKNLMDYFGKSESDVERDVEEILDINVLTFEEVFNVLNRNTYKFNLNIPDLVSNKEINLNFPSALSFLYIINKTNPIKIQESKRHSLKNIIYENESKKENNTIKSINNASNLTDFTTRMIEYIMQLNKHQKTNKNIIKNLDSQENISGILKEIIKSNQQNIKLFFTKMSNHVGYLLEDTLSIMHVKKSLILSQEKTTKNMLNFLMLLKAQNNSSAEKNEIECVQVGESWSIKYTKESNEDFFKSKSFNDINSGRDISDASYLADLRDIIIPNSDFDLFMSAIDKVKTDAALIFNDNKANIEIKQILTGDEESKNPAFDFVFKNDKDFCFVDLKTSNVESSSNKKKKNFAGNNNKNSAIKSIKSLPSSNDLANKKPMFLSVIKMIYSVFLQNENKDNYFSFSSYSTVYGDVKSSCIHSLEKHSNSLKTSKTIPNAEFLIHSDINDDKIKKALTFNSLWVKENKINSSLETLSRQELIKLQNWFRENNNTVSSISPIALNEIKNILEENFEYTKDEKKIVITGIIFSFKNINNNSTINDLPYFTGSRNSFQKAVEFLFTTMEEDLEDLEDLEDSDTDYKTFFSDLNKLNVIKFFLLDCYNNFNTENIKRSEHISNSWKNPNTNKNLSDIIVAKQKLLYNKFITSLGSGTAQKLFLKDENYRNQLSDMIKNNNKNISKKNIYNSITVPLESLTNDDLLSKTKTCLEENFEYTKDKKKIVITGIIFSFENIDSESSLKELPFCSSRNKNSNFQKAVKFLFSKNKEDLKDLEDSDADYKTFFSDLNKLNVIKFFLLDCSDNFGIKNKALYSIIDKIKKNTAITKIINKKRSVTYNNFLLYILSDERKLNISIKNRLKVILSFNESEKVDKYKHNKNSILSVIGELDNFIKTINETPNLYAHKIITGKSLKEVYKYLF